MRHWIAVLMLQVGLLLCAPVGAQESVAETVDATDGADAVVPPADVGVGTLVVDVKPFTSQRDLPKKVVRQLESGALEWGVRGGQVVFSLVNKRFIDFPLNQMTRYGQQETLSLPAGEYKVTGIGLEMTTGFSVDKILERGAFVNEDVLMFRIEAGGTTTLSINPVIYRDATFAVNFWMPTLNASVLVGEEASPEASINTRGPASIAWPNYTGPLKFVSR